MFCSRATNMINCKCVILLAQMCNLTLKCVVLQRRMCTEMCNHLLHTLCDISLFKFIEIMKIGETLTNFLSQTDYPRCRPLNMWSSKMSPGGYLNCVSILTNRRWVYIQLSGYFPKWRLCLFLITTVTRIIRFFHLSHYIGKECFSTSPIAENPAKSSQIHKPSTCTST